MSASSEAVTKAIDFVTIQNVLISLSDKTGLVEFIPRLIALNPVIRLFSTGGTGDRIAEILEQHFSPSAVDRHLVRIEKYTGNPEMDKGLVKTLDFRVYMGLLQEDFNELHIAQLEAALAVKFDMTVVNLYPFQETIADPDCTPEKARANIDIGGPTMLDASAKNWLHILTVVDPADYPRVLEMLETTKGKSDPLFRYELAGKAWAHTAAYRAAISAHWNTTSFADASKPYTWVEEGEA